MIEHDKATIIDHPNNIAFKADKLYIANLERWRIAEIDLADVQD